jgi:hypothetical protein
MGLNPTARQINNQLIRTEGEKYNLKQDNQNTTETASKPDKFLTAKKWRIFKDGFKAYTQSIRGMSNIPLTYIIRSEWNVAEGTTFSNEIEQAVATAPL